MLLKKKMFPMLLDLLILPADHPASSGDGMTYLQKSLKDHLR